jgi:hypothetical protein
VSVKITVEVEPEAESPKARHVSREARMLALAYAIERWIEDGTLESYSDAARRLGVSRARVTQVCDRLRWPLERQEHVLRESRSYRG